MSSGLDSDIRQSARLVNWCTALAALAVGVCLVMLTTGCGESLRSRPISGAGSPDRSVTVADAASGVGQSAEAIDDAAKDAVEKAPEVQPEADRIGNETGRLRQYQKDLELAVHDMRAAKKRCDELEQGIADRDHDIAALKKQIDDIQTSKLRWYLSLLGGAAVVLGALGVAFIPSPMLKIRAAAACGIVLAFCIAGLYLIRYGEWFAWGIVGIAVLAVGYFAWTFRRVVHEAVVTGEKFKTSNPGDGPGMAAWADGFQSEATKAVVAALRAADKKRAKLREAFAK